MTQMLEYRLIYPKNVFIVVDGFSTGRYLAHAVRSRGYSCIHIKSQESLPFFEKSYNSANFYREWIYRNNFEELCSFLNRFSVKGVVPGAESGVQLADQISQYLSLPANTMNLRSARRNKYQMHQAVSAQGLDTIPQAACRSRQDLDRFFSDLHWKYPLIVKPAESCASDQVFICNDPDSVRSAYAGIIGRKNLAGTRNLEVLIQPYIDGQEYVVNAVSLKGIHYITEVWKVNKRRQCNVKIYDVAILAGKDNPLHAKVSDYTQQVLDALGIQNGPSHTEIIIRDEIPLLLETAARMMGAADLSIVSEMFGTNQCGLTIEACLEPLSFVRNWRERQSQKTAAVVSLICPKHDAGKQYWGLREGAVRGLKSFFSAEIFLDTGETLKETVDLATSPGALYLLADNFDDVMDDYHKFRSLETESKIFCTYPSEGD